MASSSALQTSFSLPLGIKTSNQPSNENHLAAIGTRISFNSTASRRYRVLAAAGGEGTQKKERAAAPEGPGVDTRIHWDDPDEGWVGGDNNTNDNNNSSTNAKESRWNRFERFSDLLDDLSDSHYQFLGVPAEADMEEIKAAYRRLSKEYHPDTTSLPLKTASEKFMRLREIYDVLSDKEKRKFYDWTLAQEVASRQAEKMMLKFEDPYQQEVRNYESKPDLFDRLDGRNIELSDQARAALGFDILVITFAICCFLYVLYFKESY